MCFYTQCAATKNNCFAQVSLFAKLTSTTLNVTQGSGAAGNTGIRLDWTAQTIFNIYMKEAHV